MTTTTHWPGSSPANSSSSSTSTSGPTPTAAVQNARVDAFAGKATAIVTNVSGPRHRVQIAGTPIAGMMGWVPATGPLGLGLSIVSYAGQLSVGLAGDAHLLPDHDRLLALLDEASGLFYGRASGPRRPNWRNSAARDLLPWPGELRPT